MVMVETVQLPKALIKHLADPGIDIGVVMMSVHHARAPLVRRYDRASTSREEMDEPDTQAEQEEQGQRNGGGDPSADGGEDT